MTAYNDDSNGGYNTCIYREDQYTAFIDITTTPEGYSKVLRYITDRTAYIRQIFRTTKENHLHIKNESFISIVLSVQICYTESYRLNK